MTIRRWAGVVVLAVAAVAAPAAAARAQVATLTVKSAGDLLDRFRTLAKLSDQATARQLLDALDQLDQAGNLKWLERTRPLAATIDLVPQEPGGAAGLPAINVFVPVTNRDDFLEGLKGIGLVIDDQSGAKGFSHRVALPGGNSQPVYLLADPPAGYAVATTSPMGLEALRAVKAADLAPARPGTVLAALRIDRLPAAIKHAVLTTVRQRGEAMRVRQPGESDARYRGRMAGISLVENGMLALVRDGRELTLDVDIDEKADTFAIALAADAKPGSPMAASLKSFGDRRGRFARLGRDAAFALRGIVPVPESFRTLIRQALDEQRAAIGKDQEENKKKDEKGKDEKEERKENGGGDDGRVLAMMLDALRPTLTGDTFDAALAMESSAKGEGEAGRNVVVFAVEMKDARKVEAALREAVNRKPEDREKVAFDHAKGPDGTAIHRVTLDPGQLKPDEFGEPLMFLAFPEGAALAAVGGEGLPAIKKALATLREEKEPGAKAKAPQIAFDFSALRFSRLQTGENERSFREAAKELFAEKEGPADHLRIGLSDEGDRARLALDADLSVLRFLMKVGVLQQKAKLEKEKLEKEKEKAKNPG